MNQSEFFEPSPVTLFLCGDVMTGRGIDQILPRPSDPLLHEPYVQSALEYVVMAERRNGPIPKPLDFSYVWGDVLGELNRLKPTARIVNLETTITISENYAPKGINYRMHPGNTPCLTEASIDCCVLANNHVLDWNRCGLVETICTLRKAGIKIAGVGRNLTEAFEPAVIDIRRSGRLLVFAVASADTGIDSDWAATESRPGLVLLPDLPIEQWPVSLSR